MKQSYIIKQWGSTILLGSLLCIVFALLQEAYYTPPDFSEISTLYLMFVLISFLYSIPTYVIFILVFYFLDRSKSNLHLKKFILLFIAQAGIWISFYIISEGWFSELFLLALGYGIASSGSGWYFNLAAKTPSETEIIPLKDK